MINKTIVVAILTTIVLTGTTNSFAAKFAAKGLVVRTTAYTHTESDHVKYRKKTAIGTQLRYGQIRSAAADWSIFPLGTKLRIAGDSATYVVEDYGSALVGKRTIDLYKPSQRSMNAWGARNVKIEIVKWGSFQKSLNVLKPRAKYRHVRRMVEQIRQKM